MGKLNFDEIKKDAIEIIEPDFSYIDGKHLRKFRMELKMSQVLMADYLGVSKKAIEKWEQGKNKMNPVVARMIYLMENDPKVFSLLKQVKMGSRVFEINSNIAFVTNEIDNENSIPNVECKVETIPVQNNNWDIEAKNISGGLTYGSAGI